MLNEKRAGMPIPKQRPMPRIVAGTDLMAALKQSIEKAKEETPKAAAKQAAPAAAAAAAAKPAAAAKGKRAAKGSPDQREMLLPIAGGAPAKEAGATAKEAPEKQTAQKPGRAEKGRLAVPFGAPKIRSPPHSNVVQLGHRRHIGDGGQAPTRPDAVNPAVVRPLNFTGARPALTPAGRRLS